MKNSKIYPVEWFSMIATCILLIGFALFMTMDIKKQNQSNYDKQVEKSVTVQLEGGSQVTLKGYALLDVDGFFQVNENVYVELSDSTDKPSALRHSTDVIEENGKMYAITKFSGEYPAKLIPGKVVAVK